MNVHFHTEDDEYVPPIRRFQHRIAVDQVARQEVLLAWQRTQPDAAGRREAARLTAALVKHWLDEADKRRRQHRFLAAIGAVREALRLEDVPATRARLRELRGAQAKIDASLAAGLRQLDEKRFTDALATLEGLLALKPDHATAQGKLGTAYAAIGQNRLAVEHLQAVARSDPDEPYGHMMLGWLAYLGGRNEDAVAAYDRADEVEPFNSKTHYHRGLALLKLGRLAEAERDFRRVLVIDPKHAGGHQGLAQALRLQGRPAEAVRFARRAARLTGFRSADVLLTLADSYADAGRFADAEEVAGRALAVGQGSNPGLAELVRRRQEEWRARARQAGK
jgi:tetratricopeptide (TPR) repeat protein